ncbi:MAG: glycosyltransferase family 4 protein [Pseudomonadota bacterium]
MKILFLHQNFPGQFLYLAPEMVRRGHDVRALTDDTNTRQIAVPAAKYHHDAAVIDAAQTRLGRNFTLNSDRGVTVARAAMKMRQEGYVPDVVFGHSGWGETLFIKEVWPEAKLLIYAEFYYKGRGADVGFAPEFSTQSFDQVMIAQGRAAHLGQSMLHADAALSPTNWQASTFPPTLRDMIAVVHEGVDTDKVAPDPQASVTLPDGHILRAGDEVLTFVNRNLEPYRGYHTFIRALPAVLAVRPQAQVVIVGGDGVSYGGAPKDGKSWKQQFLAEVSDRLDLSRVHFMGKVPYPTFVALMQVSRVHAYLTYPFVLSWSMLEAMAAGALIVGSDTAPVREVIADGVNGRLVDFFDVPGWSAALTEALAHPDRFRALRAAGRKTVADNYDLNRVCLPRLANWVESHGPK